MTSNYDFPNLNMYLSDDEIKQLDLLKTKANYLQKDIREDNDPLTMSISRLVAVWAIKILEIFKDLVNMFSNFNSRYSTYFDDIDDSKQWFSGFNLILKDLIKILTEKDRAIYFGFTLIILSFLMYIIAISS